MRKMGFEGRLGKDGQGISNPIATKVFTKSKYNLFCRKDPRVWVWEQTGSKKHQRLKQIKRLPKYIIKYAISLLCKQNAGIVTEEEEEEGKTKKNAKKKNWWKDSEDEDSDENGTAEENSEDFLSATDSGDYTPRRRREKKLYLPYFQFELDSRRSSSCWRSKKSLVHPASPDRPWYSRTTQDAKQSKKR